MGVFLKGPSSYLRVFRRKITENSERLGRQARPGIKSSTTRLPALRATVGELIERNGFDWFRNSLYNVYEVLGITTF